MIKKILITALCSVAAVFGTAAYSLNANATTVEDVMAEAVIGDILKVRFRMLTITTFKTLNHIMKKSLIWR